MTELDQAIAAAYTSGGKPEDVNKVHMILLRSPLFLPIQKDKSITDDSFRPLFAELDGCYYMAVFDSLPRLTAWAADEFDNMSYVEISGKDVIAGLNEDVYLALNPGNPYYKEFSPDEVTHLKKVVARIEQLKKS